MSRKFLAVSISGMAILLGACGSSSPTDQIRSTFSQATSGLTSGDGAKFCNSLTPTAQKTFGTQIATATGGTTCAQGVTNLLKATKAISTGDWASFCQLIGPKAASGIAQAGPKLKTAKTCAAAATALAATPAGKASFDQLSKQLDQSLSRLGKGKLDKITITGDTAVATVNPSQPGDKPIKFQKVNGSWKISE